jgi:MurNAc alpha-1-phosphate uridylyltransferase
MTAIHTGMALAAGLGTRMRPLTNERPKALVDVGGQALLDWALARYAAAGLERAIVNIHHFPDLMRAHIDAYKGKLELVVSDETGVLLETGGGVVKARPYLGEEPVFLSNIDAVWMDEGAAELDRMRAAWNGVTMDALLLLAPMGRTLGFDGAGDFFLDAQGRVSRRGEAHTAPYAYAGVQIINPAVLAGEAVERFSFNRIWDRLLEQGRVHGLAMNAFWMHVGDPQARDEAERILAEGV